MSPETLSRPRLAVLADKGLKLMQVILHLGAQRTATTTLQAYLRANTDAINAQGVGFWGPLRTRHGGLLSGLLPVGGRMPAPGGIDQARRRIHAQCDAAARRGTSHLIVSDENMLGTVRRNLRNVALYPDAGARLDAVAQAFDGVVSRVVVSVRALDAHWESAWAFAVERGFRLPKPRELRRLAEEPRSWRDVVEDVAERFPGVGIQVHRHESHAGRPEMRLWHMVDGAIDPPMKEARLWLHRAPDLAALRLALVERGDDPALLPAGDGRWRPFSDDEAAALRETYDDDLFWLTAGAGGLATMIEEDQPDQAGQNLPGGATTRGHTDDRKDGTMARTG